MSEIIYNITSWINQYYGNSCILTLTFFSCIYLYVHDKESRKRLLYPIFLLIIIVANPILYKYIYYRIIYWRLLWILPSIFLIAFAFVKLIQNCRESKLQQMILFFICVLFIVYKGTYVYNSTTFQKTNNVYKISSATEQVCSYILSKSDHPKCIMPSPLTYEARQYSGNIELMFGRDTEGYIMSSDDFSLKMNKELSADSPDYRYIFSNAWFEGYDFVVLERTKQVEQSILNEYGYVLLDQIDAYSVYYCDEAAEKEQVYWRMTQYSFGTIDSSYILESSTGQLIIIDGGYHWETERLYSIIEKHEGIVNAWIITNPHGEHVSAFNQMIEEKRDIDIEEIYTIDINIDLYRTMAQSYEDLDACEEFMKKISDMHNVYYVSQGDVLQYDGLKISILNAWSNDTDLLSDAVCYNGSMSLKISSENDSFLYLSDLLNISNEYILQQCIEDENIKYIQVSNHGSWGMDTSFYDKFDLSAVFFNANDDAIAQDNPNFITWQLWSYFDDRGILKYSNSTAPNSIILK